MIYAVWCMRMLCAMRYMLSCAARIIPNVIQHSVLNDSPVLMHSLCTTFYSL